MLLFLLGSTLGLCYASVRTRACVCVWWGGGAGGAGEEERLTEFVSRHKQEMTLFGEHVSL